jgi:O-antigen biosynthesis protein WbqV
MIRLANLEPDRDVKIVYTGLRPGEKLFEELFDAAETPVPTETPSTLAAIPRPMELMLLNHACEHLGNLARDGDRDGILRFLANIVPGYRPEGLERKGQDDKHVAISDAHSS